MRPEQSASILDEVSSVHSDDSLTAVFDEVSQHGSSFDDTLQKLESKYGSETTWNDEVQSEIESLGLSLHDSLVMALRDEATKMDAVMAADHVNSLKDEVSRLSRELADRTVALRESQIQLREKEERIGTLELERDLYKADTSKLTKDLHRCMQKLKVSETSSSGRQATPRTRSVTTASEPQRDQLDHPSLSNESWGSANNSSITSTTVSRSEASHHSRLSVPVVEKPRLVLRSRKPPRSQLIRSKSRSFHFCRGFPQRRGASATEDEDNQEEEQNPDMIVQDQMQEMGRRMTTALDTADELRRRLAMVSRYYEGTLGKLEDTMVRQHSASEAEKKVIVDTLQSKMHEQELVIRDLRRRVMRPF